jgi:hypothetical protein
MGRGFPITASTKQKLKTRSSFESELVDVDDLMPIIIWTHYFLLSQGYGIVENLLLQDSCCRITRAHLSWSETGRPQAVSAKGISISDTFSLLIGLT